MLKNHKLDGMLVATFLTTLFYSATYPYIHKEIMNHVSDNLIAVNQIINCLSIVIFGYLWNKYSNKLFKHYAIFCILETISTIGTMVYVIATKHIIAYYMLDTIAFAIITRNICCGGIKLRALRYNTEEQREHFDNNNNSMSAIATIVGSLIAMVLHLDFSIMIVLATIGNIIDNIFYINIFYKSQRRR